MNRFITSAFLVYASLSFAPLASAIMVDTVGVGNAGNANDSTGFGGVTYAYRIGTFEVTNAQYAAFLNAKASTDPLELYDTAFMGSSGRGGITRSGVDGSYTYAVKADMGDKPVNYVSWYDAIRFANWMNNGQGTGSTETGAYTILGGTPTPSNGNSINRNPGATWFLPSENEWYKAAYHHPSALGGDSDSYWLYSTRSNSTPVVASASGVGDINNPGINVANYGNGATWNTLNGNVTAVGTAGPLSASFYGTFDQGGNVSEWNEEFLFGSYRGMRGGSFFDPSVNLRSSYRDSLPSFGQGDRIGFRVATIVPEPTSLILGCLGLVALTICGVRQRCRTLLANILD